MPNQYKYDHTFAEKREEEDREVYNEYLRVKTEYYKTLDEINYIVYQVMLDMTKSEVKEAIMNGSFVCPINRMR